MTMLGSSSTIRIFFGHVFCLPCYSSGAGKGTVKMNRAPAPGLAFNPEITTKIFNNLPADRQAKSGALRLVGHRVSTLAEFLENDSAFLRGQARAVIGNLDA
jgi:hypothetical protein